MSAMVNNSVGAATPEPKMRERDTMIVVPNCIIEESNES